MFTAAGEQVRFRTRKHLALLIRMALEPGKQFTRDYLSDLLWPDVAPKFGNHSLAQGLSVIKAKIAREAVVLQRSTVGLAAGWVDVDALHLTTGDAAISGPFLDGFEIGGARPFEEWKEEYRARLIPQMRDCLVRQMDAARRIGDFPTVERHALRLQELDPLAEESVRGIMEARAWASDRSGALKVFSRYESELAEELDARPSADLVRMADLLRDGRRSRPRPAVAGSAPERVDRLFEPETLIGREHEFSVLYDAWLEARHNSPRVVVISSDPGVGKTTLVNAFASSCQMDGAVVARAQAYDAERELPFAVLSELVKQLASQRTIGSADPEALSELSRISSEVQRQFPGVPKPAESPELTPLRIADACIKTIAAAAIDSAVLLVVDDIHAADNTSTTILHSVARKLDGVRVMLIVAGRTNEFRLSDSPWSRTNEAILPGVRFLDLEVLGSDSARLLINRLVASAARPDPPVDRILRATGGNPLAIELLAREWADHGAASLLGDLEALDTQPVPKIGIPRAIGAVFDRQSCRLEPSIRSALDLAAVLGRRLAEVSLYEAIEMTPGQAAASLSRLREERLLREVRGDLEFRNELIRAQAYYAIAVSTRLHLHRRVADLLAQVHCQDDETINLEIAWHYLRGGTVGRAVPFAIEGAEAVLAVGVPHAAEEILQTIVDLDRTTPDTNRMQLLLARALVDQSKADPAIPIIERLGRESSLTLRERAEVAMLRASAEYAINKEQGVRYCEVAKAALEEAKNTGDAALISRALFEFARAGTEEGITDLVQAAETGIEELGISTDLRNVPMAALAKAFCRYFFQDYDHMLLRLKEALPLALRECSKTQLSLLYSGIGLANYFLGRFIDSSTALETALELAVKLGDEARASLIASNLCTVLMARGEYEKSIWFGEMAVRVGESCQNGANLTSYTNLMDTYLLVGRESDAVQCLDKARRWLFPQRRWKLRCAFLIEAGSFALTQRNYALALDLLTQLEAAARGREEALPMPGPYWKLMIFREAYLQNEGASFRLAETMTERYRHRSPLAYLDIVAAKAWLETRVNGHASPATLQELTVFETIGAHGKKALATLQGFLQPSQASEGTQHVGGSALFRSPTKPTLEGESISRP